MSSTNRHSRLTASDAFDGAATNGQEFGGVFVRYATTSFLLFLSLTFAVRAQDRSYGRSMVVTDRGIVATSHVLASQAGAEILRRNGSAIDAAIAANAVLGVTEPMMNGIGGDLFLLYWDAKAGKLYGLNASGWAPRDLTIEHLKNKGIIKEMPDTGIDSATVPGVIVGGIRHTKNSGDWRGRNSSPRQFFMRNTAMLCLKSSTITGSQAVGRSKRHAKRNECF
jgi:Gamma-glutamyltranspeptidase